MLTITPPMCCTLLVPLLCSKHIILISSQPVFGLTQVGIDLTTLETSTLTDAVPSHNTNTERFYKNKTSFAKINLFLHNFEQKGSQ